MVKNSGQLIPAAIVLIASLSIDNNQPAWIATESFRYFSLFILLSGLASLGLIAPLLIYLAPKELLEKLIPLLFAWYIFPAMMYSFVFIGISDSETLLFIMSFL
jgi:hypothetical protein